MAQVYAIARISDVQINSNPPFVNFQVGFVGSASDGTTEKQFGVGTSSPTNGYLSIPFGTDPKLADELIRQAISAEILSFLGFTVSPEDVYIPFARKE
jgi:hypothetical protein